MTAHLWRHARSEKPLAEEVLIDFELGLAVCGDWLIHGRVEAAFLSATRLAGLMEDRAVLE